jgi:hypothetical protein
VRSAIARIKAGPHSQLPELARSVATGPVGEGLTIENGTGKPLTVYFLGPITRIVRVEAGESAGVSLVVGQYDAAAELQDPAVIPFYGSLRFEVRTHYWLRFNTTGSSTGHTAATAAGEVLDVHLHFDLPRSYRALNQRIRFGDGYLVGYSCGQSILDKETAITLKPDTPDAQFVVVEIEYGDRFEIYPPAYNAVVLAAGGKSYSYKGWLMRGGWATIYSDKFPKGVTAEAPTYPAYIGIPYEVPLAVKQALLTFGDYSELIDIQCR